MPLPAKIYPRPDARGPFNEGDHVRFRYGAYEVEAVITEDRGPLGDNGKWVYQVNLDWFPEPKVFELPEDLLTLVARAERLPSAPNEEATKDRDNQTNKYI